jgi:thiamine biosynthesis protein ThiI
MRPNRIVLRSPELTLKGRNRGLFEEALVRNVAHRLRGLGRRWRVRGAHGRVYVNLGADAPADLEEILQALTEVAGVESVAATCWLASEVTRQDSEDLNRQIIGSTSVWRCAPSTWSAGSVR